MYHVFLTENGIPKSCVESSYMRCFAKKHADEKYNEYVILADTELTEEMERLIPKRVKEVDDDE